MLPQFLIQSLWISELERKSGVSFKGALKSEAIVRGKRAPSLQKPLDQTRALHQTSQEGTSVVAPLVVEREPSISSAIHIQAPPVAASA
jgi:hypothetical protein